MRKTTERMAGLAILSILSAVVLTACSSEPGVNERRMEAEKERSAWGEGDLASLEESADWNDGTDAAAPAAPEAAPAAGSEEGGVLDADLALEALAEDEPAPAAAAAAKSGGRQIRAGSAGAGRVLDDMRLDDQRRYQEAEHWAKKGDGLFAARKYEEAEDAYRRSLDLRPDDEDVRSRHHRTLALLNRRAGEIPSLSTDYTNEIRVQRDQVRKEVAFQIAEARSRYEAGELDLAEYHAKSAKDMIRLNPDLVDAGKSDAVEGLLADIARSKAEAQETRRKALVHEAEAQADREMREDAKRRHARVQELLHSASRHLRRKEHRKAIEACESVLEIDPDNKVAAFWLRDSREQLDRERLLKVVLDRRVNMDLLQEDFVKAGTPEDEVSFPDRAEWEKVQERSAHLQVLDVKEPEAIRQIKNQLESHLIQNVNFEDTSLKEVIDTFKELAGVNILIDPDVDAEGIKVSQPINNLTAMRALTGILDSNGLTYTFKENIMMVTSKENVQVESLFDVYDVSDLLTKIKDFAAPELRLKGAQEQQQGEASISFTAGSEEEEEVLNPDQLIQLIKDTTGGDNAWVDGTNIDYSRRQLFVDAPRGLHQKVQQVLSSLRQDSDLFVVIEARFIDVNDDFLEDIGIDSRSLGLVNNLGTAFGNIINDNSTGGNDLGLVQQGDLGDVNLVMGTDRWGARVQHLIDGVSGTVRGRRLSGGTIGGGTFQATWLEPFQVNVILRMVQEKSDVRQLTAPVVTAHNNERVYVSVITQRAYIADYELVSGGTGFAIIEVADPVVQTFQEGVILDVDPTISHDKKYVTLDVRPTLATLIGGVISTINISLGSFTNVAFQVPIGIPQIALQQSFTSVTVPNGGTVLLGGFKSLQESKFTSYLPVLGKIPVLKNLARRKATIREKRSLVILLNARIVDLRGAEERMYNKE